MANPKGAPVGSSSQDAGYGNDVNTEFALDTAASDAYAIALTPAPSAYFVGMKVSFKAVTANTTGATLNVNGLGAKALVRPVAVTLTTNDILPGQIVEAVYDGTSFQITSFVPGL
jgi:hypothetical protein